MWLSACLTLCLVLLPLVLCARHMVSTLQALRGGSEVLLATMDVFLNEPVMDWISKDTGQRQNKSKRDGELIVSVAAHVPGARLTSASPLMELRRRFCFVVRFGSGGVFGRVELVPSL